MASGGFRQPHSVVAAQAHDGLAAPTNSLSISSSSATLCILFSHIS